MKDAFAAKKPHEFGPWDAFVTGLIALSTILFILHGDTVVACILGALGWVCTGFLEWMLCSSLKEWKSTLEAWRDAIEERS